MRLYNHVKIWEAACATSAASTFFDKIELGPAGQKFRDGGTGANNPVRQLWNEAKAVFCNEQQRLWTPGTSGNLSIPVRLQLLVLRTHGPHAPDRW